VNNSRLLGKILRLKELKITDYAFKGQDRELHLWVKPHKNGARCPECGRRGRIVRACEERQWTDVAVFGMEVFFLYRPKEIDCVTHGRLQEQIPWAAAHARITYRLEFRICALCKLTTQAAAAQILKMSSSTLSDQLHRIIQRTREGHKIRGLVTMGVDEISYCKGRKFATIVYDLDRSRVLWVGQGKGRETLDTFFNTMLSPYQKSRITWASCDMSDAYIGGIKAHCQNAKLVLDRFHLVKALNEAVDEVRKDAWRELNTQERKAIKGLRWMLYTRADHRSKTQTRFLNQLRTSNNRIYRAWVLKDEFEHFWSYAYLGSAEKFLKRWMTAALRSRLPSLKTFVKTLRKNYQHVITFIERPLTNAVGEGLNRIIKIVKNRASGFRNLESFTDLIYLTVGDLDIPAHIPSKLRTL
jgi:transposase